MPFLPALTPAVFWDGGASTFSWLDPLNWSTDLLPGSGQSVTIGSGYSGITVTLTGLSNINSLTSYAGITLGAGGQLTMTSGSSIYNTLTVNG
ncbi:unnamed protein product, partial [Phaeothamnion confervicola]